MMSEDLDPTAAAYVLGILRGGPRAAIEARLSSDRALEAKIKLWQENFVVVDLAAGRQVPPAGLFEMIVAAIDAGAEEELAGTVTRRPGTGVWTEMSRE
jgi:anti-sigma-K factor RskA